MPAPEMVLAKAAAHAHRIRLGTSVLVFLSPSLHVARTVWLSSNHLTLVAAHPGRWTLQF